MKAWTKTIAGVSVVLMGAILGQFAGCASAQPGTDPREYCAGEARAAYYNHPDTSPDEAIAVYDRCMARYGHGQ